MKKILIVSILSTFIFFANAQFNYSVNLSEIKNDKIDVILKCPKISKTEIQYYFPKTIPGTYMELDYGRYISNFSALDKNGNELETKKVDLNSYIIYEANLLETVTYTVADSWDEKVKKKHKVFEPAGTGFEKDTYFVFNNGAIFGCFDNMEIQKFNLKIVSNNTLTGYTSLEKKQNGEETEFIARDYHQLIDCPILFTNSESESFNIAGCEISVASFSADDSTTLKIYKEVKTLFVAIEKFTNELPVKNYNILVFIEKLEKVEELLSDGKMSLVDMIQLMNLLQNKAYGALEHGTSSLYFLPDMGKQEVLPINYMSMITDVVIHEFMHIYTPLNLHSELIGDFNYRKPKMSKHLWLYEGITEYFSIIIQMQGDLSSIDNTLNKKMRSNIRYAREYPNSMPFTEMSENVFDKPYSKHYQQVYMRGAVMAMLLDFEIMKLTDGNKTLKTVIFDLSKKYGQHKNFSEEEFIGEFVSRVHPELQLFFDKYVSGTEALNLKAGFEVIGMDYIEMNKTEVPIDILSNKDNGVKTTKALFNPKVSVLKISDTDSVGFKVGDIVDKTKAFSCFKDENGAFYPEGAMLKLVVERDGEEVELSFPANFKSGMIRDDIQKNKNSNEMQQKLYRLWTTGE